MAVLLGIDYGDVRVGLALASRGSIAVPLQTISNDATLFDCLRQVIRDESVTMVVVGMPIGLSGAETERGRITAAFVERLRAQIEVPVATEDERLTSKLAKQSGSRDVDAGAATELLQTYLDRHALVGD